MSLREISRSIGSFFRRLFRRPRFDVSLASVTSSIALLVIGILAFAIRLLPMLGFPIFVRAFDPWFNYRETQFIIENGFGAWFGWYDTTTWVPFGRNIPQSAYPGVPFTTALLYFGLRAIGIPVDLMLVCVLFPAIMGTLGVIATFFLGRELVSKEVGLFAAFFMALLPSYTQRTIAGFYDNEAIGILAIILTLYFFSRALRKGSIASAILASLSLGYLAASWSVYIYIFEVLAIVALLLILLRRYSRRLLLAYSGTILGGMVIAIAVPRIGPDFITSITGVIPLGVFGLMVLIELSRMLNVATWRVPGSVDRISTRVRPYAPYIFAAMSAFIVVGLGYLFQSGLILQLEGIGELPIIGGLASKFATVLQPLIRQTAFLLASVGEHLPSPWATFWWNLSILTLLMPLGFYMAFRREREADLLLLIFGVTALYFTGSMIRLALILAPAAALLGAYGLILALRPFRTVYWQRPILTRRRRRITPPTSRGFATVTYILVILLLLGSTITSLDASTEMGSPEIVPGGRLEQIGFLPSWFRDYLETFSWTRHHTAPGSIFISWWDYGYWIRTAGDRPTVVDNATINKTQIGWVGRMLLETDPIEALRICRRFNVSYVFVHFGLNQGGLSGDEGKWQWMARISHEVFGDEVPPEDYFWSNPDTGGNGTYYTTFFETMIYNMLYLNASQIDALPQEFPDPNPLVRPAQEIFAVFKPVFQSAEQLVKIFEVDYTRLDSEMEIGGASAYAVQREAIGDPANLTSVVLEVQNPGAHPFEIDSVEIFSTQFLDSDFIPAADISSTTGSLRVEPGESLIVNAPSTRGYDMGSDIDVRVTATELFPRLNALVRVKIQPSLQYNMSLLTANSYAFTNGTVHLEVENTGEGYLEIDKFVDIDGTEKDMTNEGTLEVPRLLFSGQRVNLDFVGFPALGPVINFTIKVTVFFMSRIPAYEGPNVSMVITLITVPMPPSTQSVLVTEQETDSDWSIPHVNVLGIDYSVALAVLLSFVITVNDFFIIRRYFP